METTENKKRVYLSGKITGDARYADKFSRAVTTVRLEFCHRGIIVNPVEWCGEEWAWWRCMVRCLLLEAMCSHVAMLPDWRESRGARIERRLALLMKKEIIYLKKIF
jgi:hypothetical protein